MAMKVYLTFGDIRGVFGKGAQFSSVITEWSVTTDPWSCKHRSYSLAKAFGDFGTVVGVTLSQLETFMVFVTVSSSNSTNCSSSS